MNTVILPPLPDASVLPKSGLPSQRSDARYNFLAQSILNSLGENGGISLIVADTSVESGFLRETLEQIHGRLSVFEVPCRQAAVGERIISSLPEFVSSASAPSRSLARHGPAAARVETKHPPMLFICDGAEGLEDAQLETMYSLSRGRHGPLGVVLLAKPEFLLRMQNSRLNHIRMALSACFWSQRSSYGAVCAADPQDQVDGFIPLDPAQLPAPLLDRLIQSEEAAAKAHGSPVSQNKRARTGRSRFVQTWRHRRLAIDIAFSVGYLLVAGGTTYVLSWISSHPEIAVTGREAPVPLGPPVPALVPRVVEAARSFSPPAPAVPPSVPAQDTASKRAPAAPANAPPTRMSEKRAPNVQAMREAQTPKEEAPLAPAEPIGNATSARSASVVALSKPDIAGAEAKLPDADRALFGQRGYELLAAGDIASARLFFERAANAGDALSALGMAKTFDPMVLAKSGVRGVKGDQAKADYWYQRAQSLAGDMNSRNQAKDNRRD